MASDALPYLVPLSSTVIGAPWRMLDGATWVEVPDHLTDWAPGTDVVIVRSVSIDLPKLRVETALGSGAAFALTVSWTSSTSSMSGQAWTRVLTDVGEHRIEATLPADRIGGVLTVRTTLTLAESSSTNTIGSAYLAGSVLWSNEKKIALEGDRPMFPVAVMDFAATQVDPRASWHLQTSTELDAPFLGTFLLLVNSRDRELVEAIEGRGKGDRAEMLLDELQLGVASLMTELAGSMRAELDERSEWPEETAGDVLRRILLAADDAVGHVSAPAGAVDLADVRTQVFAAARAAGHGRAFR